MNRPTIPGDHYARGGHVPMPGPTATARPHVEPWDDDEQRDLLTALDTRDALIGWGVFVVLGLAFYGAITYTRNHVRNHS